MIAARSPRKGQKPALDSENGHGQAYPMMADENRFSSPRERVKENYYHFNERIQVRY